MKVNTCEIGLPNGRIRRERNWDFWQFIVAVILPTLSLTMYSSRRPCYVSKKAYNYNV